MAKPHTNTEDYIVIVQHGETVRDVSYVGVQCPNCEYMLVPLSLHSCIQCAGCEKWIYMRENVIMEFAIEPVPLKGDEMKLIIRDKYHPNYGMSDYDTIIDLHLKKSAGKDVDAPKIITSISEFKPLREHYYQTINGSVLMYVGAQVCHTYKTTRNKYIVIKLRNVDDIKEYYTDSKVPKIGDTLMYDEVYLYVNTMGELCPPMQIKTIIGSAYDG